MMEKRLPIAWDNERSKLLDHATATELDLLFWIAARYWPESDKVQRELGGFMYRQPDGKHLTTVHKSSLSKAKLEAQTGIKIAFPDDYENADRAFVAIWHTHIQIKALRGDPAPLKRAKAEQNLLRASNAWLGSDVDIMKRIKSRYPNLNGYIISHDSVIRYEPRLGLFGQAWRWPSREEIPH